MVKQWVQPPINENILPPGCFLLGTHLTVLFLLRFSLDYWGKESFEIQFLAIFYKDFMQ